MTASSFAPIRLPTIVKVAGGLEHYILGRGSDHSHSHSHSHSLDLGTSRPCDHSHEAAATPGHFLEHNPCDAEDFSEVCACCQGALDVDELVGLKAAAPHEHDALGHNHFRIKPQMPTGRAGWTMAAATAWATLPGLYFGIQNHRAAMANVKRLDAALSQLQGQQHTPSTALVGRAAEHEQRNRVAYINTLRQSQSMQRFIGVFAGLLPLMGSVCMLGSVFVPCLGAVGSAFLVTYCVSHICRYLKYEWPQVKALQNQLAQAPVPGDAVQSCGLQASRTMLAQRCALYPRVAVAFGTYAVGAALLSASAVTAEALLVPLGASVLVVGLAAVVYLNNGPIKAAFGKSPDRDINRRALGSQADILQRIGLIEHEMRQLDALRAATKSAPTKPGTAAKIFGLWMLESATLVASYGLTFGLWSMGRDTWHVLRQQAQIAALKRPEHLLPEPSNDAGHAQNRLFDKLYRLPDALVHQRGALLDHFHARVALESATLDHA